MRNSLLVYSSRTRLLCKCSFVVIMGITYICHVSLSRSVELPFVSVPSYQNSFVFLVSWEVLHYTSARRGNCRVDTREHNLLIYWTKLMKFLNKVYCMRQPCFVLTTFGLYKGLKCSNRFFNYIWINVSLGALILGNMLLTKMKRLSCWTCQDKYGDKLQA